MMPQMLRIAAFALLALALVAAACDDSGGGATTYVVRVGFNESVTQENMEEVDAYLRGFDEDMEFPIQESFPPTGVGTLKTDEPDFCATVVSELEAKPYVREVTCEEEGDETPSGSPDEPVESTPS